MKTTGLPVVFRSSLPTGTTRVELVVVLPRDEEYDVPPMREIILKPISVSVSSARSKPWPGERP